MDGPVGSPASLSEVLLRHDRANLPVRHKPRFLVWQTVPCSKWLLGRNPLGPFFLNSVVTGWGVKVWDTKENADIFLKPFLFRKTLFVFVVCVFFIPIRVLPQRFKVKSSRRGSLSSAKIQTVIIPLFLKWTLPALLFQGKGGGGLMPSFFWDLSYVTPPRSGLLRVAAENIGELFPSSKFASEMYALYFKTQMSKGRSISPRLWNP